MRLSARWSWGGVSPAQGRARTCCGPSCLRPMRSSRGGGGEGGYLYGVVGPVRDPGDALGGASGLHGGGVFSGSGGAVMQLYVDMDCVLADIDRHHEALF